MTLISEESKGFKFGESGNQDPKTIQKAAKLDAYMVAYNDGQGKGQTRIVFKIPGTNRTFILQERISGSNVATVAHDWFHKALLNKLKIEGLEESSTSEQASSI